MVKVVEVVEFWPRLVEEVRGGVRQGGVGRLVGWLVGWGWVRVFEVVEMVEVVEYGRGLLRKREGRRDRVGWFGWLAEIGWGLLKLVEEVDVVRVLPRPLRK